MTAEGTNYIDAVALGIQAIADPNPSADWLPLYRIYAVLVLAKGAATTMEDVHDAWSAFTAGIDPQHRSLVPFADLSTDVQAMDWPFMEAIHRVAARPPARRAGTPESAYTEWLIGRYGDRAMTTPGATFHGEMRYAFQAGAEWQAARPAPAAAPRDGGDWVRVRRTELEELRQLAAETRVQADALRAATEETIQRLRAAAREASREGDTSSAGMEGEDDDWV